jgi:aspartate carbamoyltransferase catalytic subunit
MNVGAMMGSLSIKNLVSFSDLPKQDLELILDTAGQMAEAIGFGGKTEPSPSQPLDRILGTAFFEPSTRTRLSFESAMLRLGGQTLGFAEAKSSSAAKGEAVADTVQIMSAYCDIIVMRHPLAGAAKVAARAAEVPFINAGDGSREHPTQTLTDLFCIRREFGTLAGLKIGLCGDLKYGRTVHSLAPVMAQMGSEIVCIAPDALKMPERYLAQVETSSGARPAETESLEQAIADLDVLYMTRIQRERFDNDEQYRRVAGVYVLTPDIMAAAKAEMRVLHPLPRVNEISVAVDADPRAAYFRQAAGGVPVRMALIALLLELPQFQPSVKGIGLGKPPKKTRSEEVIEPKPEPTVVSVAGPCRNKNCITNSKDEPLEPEFIETLDGRIICAYCEQEYEEN